ncbi:GNAT family N-acetyltransferase [Herbiconiux sp. KACC 21604]|uniref:GNAT family N-acetyltransferase n=1 Tax=unclassified Herbiconiux TaxID=2618217 RepID=UPI001491F999|nr:GNAT family N-acetyltransferase [Herbiconiux sp. SALV-R1]QJU55036.1 GNAT family N-acetyltransferase [Herbiconiux sp. SALV-R1]WPO86176.1 GNAT family N-acetyltransferase [Herbiconiux sp. KACC 21604]
MVSHPEQSAYRFDAFPARRDEEGVDPRSDAWLDAVNLGFLVPPASPQHRRRLAGWLAADGAVLDAASPESSRPGALQAPVATFADYGKPLTVAVGRELETHLVVYVTVRPTHRRRGLLRRLMERSLDRAVEAGRPLAALTASEGAIYGRFGFGPATSTVTVVLDSSKPFALAAPLVHSVELVSEEFAAQHSVRVFERFHRSRVGSVGRPSSYPEQTLHPFSPTGDADTAVRYAAAFAADGSVDAVLCYRPSGWTGEPGSIEVVDLVAVDTASELALWDFLAGVDMVDTVTWRHAPVDPVLPWAVTDPDSVRVERRRNAVWLRVLDVVEAFSARGYERDDELLFSVGDPQGYAAGAYRLVVREGVGEVERVAGDVPVDLELDAPTLASLYLGGTEGRAVARSGRMREHTPGAAERFARLLRTESAPYGVTEF